MANQGYCCWVQYFGDYCYTTSCGHHQGITVRPKQKKCYCGRQIKRYVQDMNGGLRER